MSDFFEPPSPSQWKVEWLPPEEWMEPPGQVLPAVLPIEQIVGKAESGVVYVDNLWVYPSGFEVDLFAVAKGGETLPDPMDFEYQAGREGEIPSEKLRVGFEFADGSSVANIRSYDVLPPKPPKMSATRGSYAEDEWELSYWVWPVPPAGPMTLVCEWPAMEIPLTRVELDSQAIIDAADRAQEPFPVN